MTDGHRSKRADIDRVVVFLVTDSDDRTRVAVVCIYKEKKMHSVRARTRESPDLLYIQTKGIIKKSDIVTLKKNKTPCLKNK